MSVSRKACPSRATWAAIGAVGAVGSLWVLALLWRRAWGISSSPTFAEPAAPEAVAAALD